MNFRPFALIAVLAGCASAKANESAKVDTHASAASVAVRTVVAAAKPVERPIRANGLTQASRELALGFKAGGVVARVNVRVGDRVKAGDVLAIVDASEFAAGALQAAESVQKAQRDVERAEGLYNRGTIALADVQNARTGLSVAKAALAGAQVNVARAALRAPVSGIIDYRDIDPGEVVAPGRPIFRLNSTETSAIVRVAVTAEDIATLEVGSLGTAMLDGETGQQRNCSVTQVATSATPATGLFEVEAALEAPGNVPAATGQTTTTKALVRTGVAAQVEFARRTLPHISVPMAALVDGEGMHAAVFLNVANKAVRKPIQVSFLQGESAVLAGGLRDGDLVIIDGVQFLRDGTPVAAQP
jgi:membrane fusion protein, multidrug efflux system